MNYVFNYFFGIELETPSDPVCAFMISIMKKSIDNSFRKYHAQCENGKKGGAPKGNKNAAKKKHKPTEQPEQQTRAADSDLRQRIALVYKDVIHRKSETEDYSVFNNIHKRFIAACYALIGCDSFTDLIYDFNTLSEAAVCESAPDLCSLIVSETKKRYQTQQHEEPFDEAFKAAKVVSAELSKLSEVELLDYVKRCEEQTGQPD